MPSLLINFLMFLTLTLLCHCAVKHQPREFAPHFYQFSDYTFDRSILLEMKELETKGVLSLFEKKRLLDLYVLELKQAKSGSERSVILPERIQALRIDVADLEKELEEVRVDNLKQRELPLASKGTEVFGDPTIKQAYLEARGLWNKDQNSQAAVRIDEITESVERMATLTSAEQFRLLNLKFRILFDLGIQDKAQSVYQKLKDLDSCAPETTHAGFLISLIAYTQGDSIKANSIFLDQCDSDKSSSNTVRRDYWLARFSENDPAKSHPLYTRISQSVIANYYSFLASFRLNKKIDPARLINKIRPYLQTEIEVSRKVQKAWVRAEDLLTAHLRRDAGETLLRAALLLKKKPDADDLPSLLYTAHLFQAAGDSLEAMKIYSLVNQVIEQESVEYPLGFLSEMFPRPFLKRIEWLSRLWNVDSDFVYAIMRQESAFNPGAISSADARGLMQLMPKLARSLSKQWSYNRYFQDKLLLSAAENLNLAVFHLHQLSVLTPHPVLMAAAYNAGATRTTTWWKRNRDVPMDVFVELIPITETRNYVKLVTRNYIYYRALKSAVAVDSSLFSFIVPPAPL